MPPNDEQRRRLPFWHRRRLGWVNALGFALTLFLGLWLLLTVFSFFLPGADPLAFPIPVAFIAACGIAQLATVVLGAVIVLVFAWRGADFTTHEPRLYVFFWTCAGLLFYLCQGVTLLKFGFVDLPNVARWAEDFYWGCAPIGLLAFGLMAYVNIDIPGVDDEHEDDEAYSYRYVGDDYVDDEEDDLAYGDDEELDDDDDDDGDEAEEGYAPQAGRPPRA